MAFDDAPGPALLMRRVHRLQQLEHPASAVSRFCRQVPSSLAARSGPADPGEPLSRLSDVAFGYRVTPHGLARHAPSAGAMYPVELAWLTHHRDRWVFRHFDARRRACVDAAGPAREVAESLRLAPGQHALLLLAVAWRTVQRYGVRGYRYCNLDAGNVLANVAAVAIASGVPVRLPESVPHDRIHAGLGLGRDELLLGVAVLDGEPRVGLPGPGTGVVAQALDQARLFGTEQAPLLAPSMQRIRGLHRLAEPGRQHPVDLPALLGGRDPRRVIADILLRRSARAFDDRDLSVDALAELEALLGRAVLATAPAVRRELEVRVLVRQDGRWRADRFDPDTDAGGWTSAPVEWPGRAELESVFGDQPLAVRPPVHVVVGLRGTADARTDPAVYRQLLLTAGLFCGAMYQLATRQDVATTSIGGFDDHRVAALAGGGFRPVVVQSFGHAPEEELDEKNDTVAATWLHTTTSQPTSQPTSPPRSTDR